MWTRALIKSKAKEVLRFTYWKSFLVSLVILFAGGRRVEWHNNNRSGNTRYYGDSIPGELFSFIDEVLIFFASIALILMILRVLLGYILEVGSQKYFIKASEGEVNMGFLGFGFRSENYLDILVTMFLRSLYTFLWTLLLIIPGIIKYYSYRMVPYILADNPNIGHSRAIELSKQMTDGEKFDIFVLDLSFIGWYILGALALGVGVLFVNPYNDATNAELYLILRQNAIDSGKTSYSELNLEENEKNEDYNGDIGYTEH